MRKTRLFLMTTALISLSPIAMGQTATQIQQQQTEAASADQAAKTNAAAQGQAQKTQAASQEQARKTEAATQGQANETAARVGQQPGGTVYIGIDPVSGVLTQPQAIRVYNTGTSGQIAPGNTIGGANVATPPAEKQLQDLFNTIDTDHSGMISKTEFSIYYNSTPDDPRFDSYDTNRDMMISYFEFRAPNVSGMSVVVPSH